MQGGVGLCIIGCGLFLLAADARAFWDLTATPPAPLHEKALKTERGTRSGLRIIENTPQRLRFQIDFPELFFSQEEIDGVSYDVPRLAGFDLIHTEGLPAQPGVSYLIILPPGDLPSIQIVKGGGQYFEERNLLPSLVPRVFPGTDSLVYKTSPLSSQSAFDIESVRIVETGWWRGFRLGRLCIAPLQAFPNGGVQFYASFTVDIEFPEAYSTDLSPLIEEEKQLLCSALNYQIGSRWRRSVQRQGSINQMTRFANHWTLPEDSDVFKIAIDADGLYSLSYEYLSTNGVPVDRWHPAYVHLWHRGEEVPLHFAGDGDSLFEAGERFGFFGARRRGEKSYYNDYGNENIYWLNSDTAAGLRMRQRSVIDNALALPNTYFFEKKHFEEDDFYYNGDNSAELFNTLQLPGEGWIWRRLLAGEQLQASLLLQNTVTNAPACSMTVRLRGITFDPVKPNHRIQFLVNGNFVGEAAFSDNKEVTFRAEFPSTFVRVGNNSFEAKSAGGTGAAIDQIYFDWVEIGYWRSYVASDNVVPFRAGLNGTAGSPEDRFVLFNLHNANIEIYDRTRHEMLAGFAVSRLSATQWQASFIDSASTSDYLALTPEALKIPTSITRNSPSSLRSGTTAADYIILTHHDFRNAAERLASHRRRTNQFRVVVAEIEDVDDEFNFGMPDPEAIRSFFRGAYESWLSPAPRYVLLVGDASWDPKFNDSASRKQNFIVPFGNPVSDNRFVCFDGENDFIPEMFIGRLPVESAEQAEAVVDKIISYENDPTQSWHKSFTFLNGGIDTFEQQLFLSQTEGLINRYVLPTPVAGKPLRVYKNTPGRLIGELREEIISAIDNGTLMLNFLGHAGSQTWELMLINQDIFDLQNRDRLPFVTSMSCHTARYANPDQDSFGETFVRLPERGAVAFWGTSGWGFIFQDGVLLDKMYEALVQDSVRTLGALTTLAKMGLWQQWGGGITTISSIDQYSLLGDPATALSLPRSPDLIMQPSYVSFFPNTPTDQTSQVNVKVLVRNYGLATTDSVSLEVEARGDNNTIEKIFAGGLRHVGFSDSIAVNWRTSGHRGDHRIRVIVDPQNRIAENDESNNEAETGIYFFANTITSAAPAPNAKVNASRPALAVHNPALVGIAARSYFFEIDTTADFSSGFRVASPAQPEGVLRTSWQVPQPLADGLYFWRCRVSAHNVDGPWQTSSFRILSNGENGFAQAGGRQLAEAMLAQTEVDGLLSAITLARDPSRGLSLEVQSAGFEDAARCYLIVNFQLTNAAVQSRGHQILALDPVTHEVIAGPRYFDTFASTEQADSLAMFVEALPQRALVLTGIRDDGSQKMTERAYKALESLGSAMTRQVGFRDGWAMIGQKGMSIGEAAEDLQRRGTGTAAARFTHRPFYRSGEVRSPAIGPGSSWKTVRWQGDDADRGATLAVDLYGRNQRESSWSLVRSNVDQEHSLAEVDVQRFPFLQLVARLTDDDGLDSPRFVSWEVDFDDGTDLAVGASTLEVMPDSLIAGGDVSFRAQIYNFGAQETSTSVAFLFSHPDSGRKRFAAATIDIPAHGSSVMNRVWNSAVALGRIDLFVEVDPENQIAEAYELNNFASVPVQIIADSSAPELRVTVDGRTVLAGDFVSAKPLINCEVLDDGAASIGDTSQINILLDGGRVSFQGPGDALAIESLNVGKLKARILYRPELSRGNHVIEFFVRDVGGNTGYARVEAHVETDFRLLEVMNYPNPFRAETEFTYYLTQPAESVSIKIFTLSGKLICVFENSPTAAGFNRQRWDGLDADGDELANGVYLFKISARQSGRIEEEIQKCVVMR